MDLSSEKPKATERILWAIDAFSDHPEHEVAGVNWLPVLTKGRYQEIAPVFVLDDIEDKASSYHPAVTSSLDRIARSAQVPGVLPPKVVDDVPPPYFSELKSVNALLDYAKAMNAGLIVAHAHEKSLLQRLLGQSFAETLIEQSPIPVLLLGPEIVPAHPVRKIACLVNEEPRVKQAFETAIEIASALDAEVIVLRTKEAMAPARMAGLRERQISSLDQGPESAVDVCREENVDVIVVPRPCETVSAYEPVELALSSRAPVWVS